MNIIICILLIAVVFLLTGIYNVGNEILNALKILYQTPVTPVEDEVESLPDDNNASNPKKAK